MDEMNSLPSRFLSLFCFLGLVLLTPARADVPTDLPATCYIFCYFMEPNGVDGLHLAWSRDGLKWDDLNGGKGYLKPTVGKDKLMRDPCLLLGPDNVFRLVWTDSWKDQSIGYASSKDLITWSDEKSLPVMSYEPTTQNTWAPEVHYDAANQQYLIFWSSTIPGKFPETENSGDANHRFYVTTTKDFDTYTPTTLLYDPGFNCIDATVLQVDAKFYLIFKNETKLPTPQKNIWLATSDNMAGPYSPPIGPIKTEPDSWVEGPTAIKIGDNYIIYYDCYRAHHFGAIKSTDMQNWEDITSQLSMPKGIRHGTVIAVPSSVVATLLQQSSN
jgi:hypothetical protein